MIPLSPLDYVLIGIVGVSALIGYVRGLLQEAMSLLVWLAAIWVAVRFGSLVAPYLVEFVANGTLRLWSARFLLLVGVLVTGAIVTGLVAMALHKARLGGTDRVVGMIFGLARGVLLTGLVVIVLKVAGLNNEPWWRESKLIPYAAPVADAIRDAAEKGFARPWFSSTALPHGPFDPSLFRS